VDVADYLKFYDLEKYLFEEVGPRFRSTGRLNPIDLFVIFIWKANRAKTKVRDKLKRIAGGDFRSATEQVATALFGNKSRKERLAVLMRDFELGLPMATAILAVLYPEEFTVYDYRVCKMLGQTRKDWRFSDACWSAYEEYIEAVRASTSSKLSLRNKDRALWAKSFWLDAQDAVESA
jgi:hypothetical protein